jgi:tRNA A-37 threonylcarbamoyl transferase component Bud32
MVVPPTQGVRVVRSRVSNPRALAAEVGDPAWSASAKVLKRDGRTAVLEGRVTVDGRARDIVVKVMRADRPKDRLARRLGGTRLMRQWSGAALLERAGIATPACLALWRSAGGVECLAMERAEGRTLLHEMARAGIPVRDRHALAGEAGRLVAQLVRAGVFNRDHKPSNIMVRWDGAGPRLSLIDTAGIRRRRAGGETVMLAKLVIECLGVGARPRTPIMMRALCVCATELGWDRARRRRTWKLVEYVISAHGNPRPKDDPLG